MTVLLLGLIGWFHVLVCAWVAIGTGGLIHPFIGLVIGFGTYIVSGHYLAWPFACWLGWLDEECPVKRRNLIILILVVVLVPLNTFLTNLLDAEAVGEYFRSNQVWF